MKQVKHFDHLNMTVQNLQESLEWYRRIFGFTLVESGERDLGPWAIVRSGEAMLCLYERAGRTYEIPYGDGPHHGICHFAIRITDREFCKLDRRTRFALVVQRIYWGRIGA